MLMLMLMLMLKTKGNQLTARTARPGRKKLCFLPLKLVASQRAPSNLEVDLAKFAGGSERAGQVFLSLLKCTGRVEGVFDPGVRVESVGKLTLSLIKTLDMSLIRRYITMCKRKLPVISPELSECIVNAYVKLPPEARRNHDLTRNLLGILRLLITLSLPRLADEVYKDDVQKALRLLEIALVRELAGANKTAKILDAMERCPIIVLFVFYLFHPGGSPPHQNQRTHLSGHRSDVPKHDYVSKKIFVGPVHHKTTQD
ncbi:conserved hypothetical protein [Culex quinquefasciatus]|uniref:DNA replication licensing factor MCM7 n=1 Tax=Culex quinquefasciatus TaxID=7176 RepID=B0XJ45_CULQU|nr:conserved hypothetical protein [Culex quinquefasciatus]|eukprot:XP_001869667.1 conserved hypothetical protein [Culex quinquefasciatus]